jgi:hypothetical protein
MEWGLWGNLDVVIMRQAVTADLALYSLSLCLVILCHGMGHYNVGT